MKSIKIVSILLAVAMIITSVNMNADSVLAAGKKGLNKKNITIFAGKSDKINLQGDKIKSVKSSKSAVVKVSKKGKLTAKKAGKAKVTITGSSGKKYTCNVTVRARLNYKRKDMKVGQSFRLKIIGTGIKKISSSNTGVATVNRFGKVKAIGIGKANITVKASDKKKYVCRVDVRGNDTIDNNMTADLVSTSTQASVPASATNAVSGQNVVPTSAADSSSGSVSTANTPEPTGAQNPLHTPVATEIPDKRVRIVTDGSDNNYLITDKDMYDLSGSIDTTETITSLKCSYCNSVEEQKKDILVDGTVRWRIDGTSLEIGSNIYEFTITTIDGSEYSDTVVVMRNSTEVVAASGVVGYDVNDSEQLNTVKEIYNDIIEAVPEENGVAYAVMDSNPLYKSIIAGDIKKDEIVYIPANEYFLSDTTLRYKYCDDNCGKEIAGYNSSYCKVIHFENVELIDMLEGDVSIAANTLDEDDPLAFVYSPYAPDDNMTTMAAGEKGVQTKKLFTSIEAGLNENLAEGELGLKFNTVIYDQDGNEDTKYDQVSFDFDYTASDIKPIIENEKHSISKKLRKLTAGVCWNENLNAIISVEAKADTEKLVEKLNGKFENKMSGRWADIAGVDVSDTVFLCAFGIRVGNNIPIQGIKNIQDESIKVKFNPIIVFSIIMDLKGEIKIKSSYTYNQNAYCERGIRLFEDSEENYLGKPFLTDVVGGQSHIKNGFTTYILENYDGHCKSKDDINSAPERTFNTNIEGSFEGEIGIGAAVGAMICGIMPAVIRGVVGPFIKGEAYIEAELRNYPANTITERKVFDGKHYLDIKGNAEIKLGIQILFDVRLRIKVESGLVNNDLSYENPNNRFELCSLGISALKLNGHVYEVDEDTKEEKPLSGAVVSIRRNNIINADKDNEEKESKHPVTDSEGNFETQYLYTTNDTESKLGRYTINIKKEKFADYEDSMFELSNPKDKNKRYDFEMKRAKAIMSGTVYIGDDDTDHNNDVPLENARVALYNKSDNELYRETYTDSQGQYLITDIILNDYIVIVEKEEYSKIKGSQRFDSNREYRSDFIMESYVERPVLSNPVIENGVTTWDCVEFGNYYQKSADYKNPVKWRVLDIDGDEAFLISDTNLDTHCYHDSTDDGITWSHSDIRKWLNSTFLNAAFDEYEQNAITWSLVVNNDNPTYGTEGGINTEDKIYLMSIEEVMNSKYGFTSDDESSPTRESINTAYVSSGGSNGTTAMEEAGSSDFWWLRSAGNDSCFAANVDYDGSVYAFGDEVRDDNFAVRPVLHLDLRKVDLYKAAGTVTSDGEVSHKLIVELKN